MKKILILAIVCVATARDVELENICSGDSFKLMGVRVNAFHRLRMNVTFQPLHHYLINDSVNCDPAEFENKKNFWSALKFKHE